MKQRSILAQLFLYSVNFFKYNEKQEGCKLMITFDYSQYPLKSIVKSLVLDKNSGSRIVFGTDIYSSFGEHFGQADTLNASVLAEINLQPGINRRYLMDFVSSEQCKAANDAYDDASDISGESGWYEYIETITVEKDCGEAPYTISRYDASTGEIIPIDKRFGVLDRKMMRINNKAASIEGWQELTETAFKSTYGCEQRGDLLVIARINMLMSYVDYYMEKWKCEPELFRLRSIANILCWNFWQNSDDDCRTYDWKSHSSCNLAELISRKNTRVI